jgi:hypothetical protein
MRILIRTSKWAIWSRRIASFALPLAIVPIFMHRGGMISSETFHVIMGTAIFCALVAMVMAISSFARLWVTGDKGWVRAAFGVVFSLIVLVPAAYAGYAYWKYPRTTDVSTDFADPPLLVSDVPPVRMTTDLARSIAAAFPNVASRTYPIGPEQVFDLATNLVRARGWEIEASLPPPGPQGEGQLNAIVLTLLGWRDEISLRITGVPEGSTVAMRSSSMVGVHDLGENGHRIEEFMLALDTEVTVIMRDAPANAPVEEPATEEGEGESDA